MDIQKEREAFESWFESRYGAHFMQFALDLDFYVDKHTQTCWEAWQAAKAQAVPEWISVEDELPKDGAKVLCYGRQFMCVGVFDGDDFFDPLDGQSFVKDCITHWMQLPASPKAQEPAND